MKCFNHRIADAIAVCSCCGRALCPDCVPSPAPERIVCSPACAATLKRSEDALQLLLHKSSQSARASAFYCYLCGGLSLAAAVAAWFLLPSPFLIYFTAACGVALIFSGFWYQRGAGKQNVK